MAYKLEHSNDEQRSLLSSTVQKWSNCQPDMYIISTEGHKIYTQRILLGLYSNLIDGLLLTTGLGDLPGISVPASSGCLVNLLKILTNGVAIANNKAHLLEAATAAKAIGIKLNNCQIGIKKKKVDVSKPPVSNGVRDNQTTYKDKKRKIEAVSNLSKKPKVEENVPVLVKQEVEDQEEFNDLLLNGAEVTLKEGHATDDEIVEGDLGSNEKVSLKLSCSQCEKDFSSKGALKRHSLIHTDNPTPFECDHCEQKFVRKYRLDKHVKTAHNDVTEPEKDFDDASKIDQNVSEDQTSHKESQKDDEAVGLENIELNENEIQAEEGMDENEITTEGEGVDTNKVNEAPDVSDSLTRDHEQLLSDRKKLLAELSDIEGESHGELDFLNVD